MLEDWAMIASGNTDSHLHGVWGDLLFVGLMVAQLFFLRRYFPIGCDLKFWLAFGVFAAIQGCTLPSWGELIVILGKVSVLILWFLCGRYPAVIYQKCRELYDGNP